MTRNLNILYRSLMQLRNELEPFEDADDGIPNEAMRIVCDIDEAMGDTPYLSRSRCPDVLNACIDRALDYLNPKLGC